MRRRWLFGILILLALAVRPTYAAPAPPEDFGGGPIEPPQSEISDAEWASIQHDVDTAIAQLEADGRLSAASGEAVSFGWPLRAANGLTDYGYHGVSGFVDHNPATGAWLDYTCGNRSYDLSSGYDHQGTDFFTYPYPWYKVEHSEVEIVAAAAGTLVSRHDGEYDRQCAMTGVTANSVVIRHADGTLAYYLHMKKGSVTPKGVGASIAAGEYLGVVASSGSSTGPHLHFEVRSATNQVLDPFHGACNAPASMWADQPPYYDSAVIAVHTGDAPPYRPACPGVETTHIEDHFAPDDTVYFVTTYRDQLAGQQSTYRVIRPDGSTYQTRTYTASYPHYTASYWYWSTGLDLYGTPPLGTWRLEVDFEGRTYENEFHVGVPTAITVTYPNGGEAWPTRGVLPITWDDTVPGNVGIDLYAGGALTRPITTSTPSDGVVFWGIPADLAPRADYQVRITELANPAVFDESDAAFTIAPVPVADFVAAPVTGIAPLTVSFTDTSSSLVDAWRWGFGDGITATLQYPTHVYTTTGVYTVTLSATGPTGTGVVTRTDAITVTPPPLAAAFTGYPILGTPPLTVTFTDRSVGPPVGAWAWAFGDGITSTLQHPVHAYTQTGVYTVTLGVIAADDDDLVARPAYVHVVDQVWGVYLPLALR